MPLRKINRKRDDFMRKIIFFAAVFLIFVKTVSAEEVAQVVTNKETARPYVITGESLIALIKEMAELKDDSSIAFHRQTGQLFVRTTEVNHKTVENILDSLRNFKTRQVIIEARFVELRDFDGVDIGFELNNIYFKTKNTATKTEVMTTPGQTSAVDFAAGSWGKFLSNVNPGLTLFTTLAAKGLELDTVLKALAQKVKVDTLSAPRIMCFNNQRANIRVATQTNYVKQISGDAVSTTTGTTTTVDVTVDTAMEGVSLDVTPTYNEKLNTITLELHPAVVSADLSNTQTINTSTSVSNSVTLPVFVDQTIDTTVTIPDGGTVVLGGLITERMRNDIRKVPVLGDIPVMEFFFSYKTRYKDKSILLIFITAKAKEA
jgi:general secretion pathway protein D